MNKTKDFVAKESKKAHKISDYTEVLTHRIISNATDKLVKHAYRTAKDRGTWGKDYHFERTDTVTFTTTYVNSEMERMMQDVAKQSARISKKIGERTVAKVPKDNWDDEVITTALIFGKTYRTRITKHNQRFRKELEVYIGYGQHNDLSAFEVISMFISNLKNPTKPRVIQDFLYERKIKLEGVASFNRMISLNKNTADHAFQMANKYYFRFAKKLEIVAVIDTRTCDVCKAHNGKIVPLNDKQLPAHPSCRCWYVPKV